MMLLEICNGSKLAILQVIGRWCDDGDAVTGIPSKSGRGRGLGVFTLTCLDIDIWDFKLNEWMGVPGMAEMILWIMTGWICLCLIWVWCNCGGMSGLNKWFLVVSRNICGMSIGIVLSQRQGSFNICTR